MTKYIPNKRLSCAWVVDIDGTMTMGPHERGPFEWSKVGQDQPNDVVMDLVRALAFDGYDIVFASGRSEECRAQTEMWISHHYGDAYTDLLMRREGDFRPDEIVKSEMFDRYIAPTYYVLGVIDDRAKVVKMWREKGLTCLQVAEGDF